MFNIESEFRSLLQNLVIKLDANIETITNHHIENLQKLDDQFKFCIENILAQRLHLEKIISSTYTPSPKYFYPLVSYILNLDQEEFENEEKKKWAFDDIVCKSIQDIYPISIINELSYWNKKEIPQCDHELKEVVMTYCKQYHCKKCLEIRVNAKKSTCMCDERLSPKDFQEIMGFDYDINRI
jgi:hypothetical protein